MLQSLWNSRYVAVCVCDLRGRVLDVNDAACGFVGRARATLLGGSIYDAVDNSDHVYDVHQHLLGYAKADKSTIELVRIMSASDLSHAADSRAADSHAAEPLSFWQVAAEDVAEADVTLELRTTHGTLSIDAEVSCYQTSKGEVFLVHVLPVPATATITPLQPAAHQTPAAITTDITGESSDYHASVRHWLASMPEVFDSLLPGAIAIVDRDGVYHDVRHAPGFVPRVPPEQCLGKTFEEVLPADIAKQLRYAIEHVFRSKQPYYFTSSTMTPEGMRYYEVRYSYLDEQFCVGVKYDVTERKQLEQRLAASNARAQALVDAIPDGVMTISRVGVFESVQLPKDFALQYSPELFIGKHLDDIPEVADMREAIRHYVAQTLDSKKQHTHSYEVTVAGKTHYRDLRFSYLDENTCLVLIRDVSEWMDMALSLQDVQVRFDRFMQTSDDIFAVVDLAEETLLYINASYERLTGYSPRAVFSDMASMGFLSTIDPRDHERMYRLRNTLQQGRGTQLELRLLCRDGSTRWLLVRSRVVLGGQSAIVVATDISELKRSQAELAASRDELRNIYYALPDAIARLDSTGKYVSVKMPSYFDAIADRDTLLGSYIEDTLPPDVGATLRKHFERTRDEGVLQVCRYDVPHQGEVISREVRFVCLANGDVLGVYRDITKRRRTERALKRRNRDMQALIDALPDSIFRLDRMGVCLEHKAAGAYPVYPPSSRADEMQGSLLTDFAPPEIVPLLHHHMDTLRATGELQVFNYALARDGQTHYREAHLVPMSNGEMLLHVRDISHLRRTERTLLQRERDTRILLEALPDAIMRFDHEGVCLDSKLPNYANINPDMPASEMIGKRLEDIAPAEAVPVLKTYLAKTLETQQPQQCEYRLQQHGRTFDRDARFMPLDNAEVLVIVRDITRERHSERELARRERQLQAIFNTLPYDIIRYNREGVCLEHKPARDFQSFSPHAQAGIVGKSLAEIAHPDSRDIALSHFAALLETNQARVFDYQLQHEGRTIYREATFLPLGDDEVLSVVRDVSEQRRLEQTIIESEQQMRAIFSAIPDVIAQFSREGVYLGDIHSGRVANLVALEQVQGKTFLEMDNLTADDARALQAALEQTFRTQKEHNHEYDIDISGKTYRRELRFVYLNEAICLGILRDITPWHEMDMALQGALEHSTALLKEVHHRVRNNLQVLSSVLHLHAASLEDDLAKRVLLENRRRIQTLALVHRVLYDNESYAKIALDQYLSSGAGLFAADMRRLGVVLELDTESVFADLDHAIPFGLIVNELISNALRHAFVNASYQDGTLEPRVHIALQQQDNTVTLEVSDNGVGLPADFHDTPQDTLGMTVITSLSEQLEGTFHVHNRDGADGTRAILTFTC